IQRFGVLLLGMGAAWLMSAAAVRPILRRRRIMRLVPQFSARVCPACVRAMDSADDETCTCPRCGACWPEEELEALWEQTAHRQNRIGWLVKRLRRYDVTWRRHMWAVFATGIDHPYRFGIIGGVFGAVIGILLAFLTGSRVPVIILGHATVTSSLIAGGVYYLALQWGKSTQGRFCATCSYEKDPAGEPPPRCPECGADWSLPGATMHVRRLEGKVRIPIASIALLLLIFIPGVVLVMPSKHAHLLPTSVLVRYAVTGNILSSDSYWAELSTRTMTPEQKLELAQRVLDKRASGEILALDTGLIWLDKYAAAGRMDPDMLERFYAGMLALHIEGPARVRVGEQIQLEVWGQDRSANASRGTTYALVLVEGFYVGDAASPIGRHDTGDFGSEFDSEQREFAQMLRLSLPEPAACMTFTPDQPGEVTVRAAMWIVIAPTNAMPTALSWAEDDSIITPPGTSWTKRVELEHVLEVSEALAGGAMAGSDAAE
ncbi:MAG: hypothetical protein KAS72_15335, partial [Phycisphaerales bacterium]|nr:hypothetical protein [Phycisphaerales bacterium]